MTNITLGNKLLKNQFLRFILSAGLGFLVDILAFNLFYDYVFLKKNYAVLSFSISSYNLSFTISYILGVLVNFSITRLFVFSESKSSPSKQFIRFISVAFIGYFANLAVLDAFINYLHVYPPVARPAAALSLFFLSYFVHKFFSFSLSLRHHAPGSNAG
jgi:putative flippase GtrA